MTEMQQWYKGRNVFITGGTGFMGKVLVEKMLRSLPDLGNVYLLVRSKRGLHPNERMQNMKQSPIFNKLKQNNGGALDKIKLLEGNIIEDNLGLNEVSINCLVNEVSVVFHLGASLRLEAEIKEAVTTNTLGTLQLLKLCKQLKQAVSVVHLSTAFCHCDIPILEEKIYESPQNPYDILKLIQTESDEQLRERKVELISPHPNAYTFSKRLAESIVADYATDVPLVICRPSIVLPAYDEPIPGWVDSLNGPVGILVAGGKGVLRSMPCKGDNNLELIPVDIAINAIIFWGYYRSRLNAKEIPVANISAPRDIVTVSLKTTMELGLEAVYKYPFEWMLWYPGGSITTNFFLHWLKVILFQWIPALVIDSIILVTLRKPFLIRVQQKILVGIEVLKYFTLNEWNFETHKSLQIMNNNISNEDKEIFKTTNIKVDMEAFTTNAILGARKYCLKENESSLPYTRVHLKILYVLHNLLKITFFYFGLKLFLSIVSGMVITGLIYALVVNGINRILSSHS